jgi:hypothetical protein
VYGIGYTFWAITNFELAYNKFSFLIIESR